MRHFIQNASPQVPAYIFPVFSIFEGTEAKSLRDIPDQKKGGAHVNPTVILAIASLMIDTPIAATELMKE